MKFTLCLTLLTLFGGLLNVRAQEVSSSHDQKPIAHIVAQVVNSQTLQSGDVITDWNPSDPLSILRGGMTYGDGDGTVIVPTAGPYYVYAQMYYLTHLDGRINVLVNGDIMAIIQPTSAGQSSMHVGVVLMLNSGDTISLGCAPNSISCTYDFAQRSTYFGAFRLD